MIREVPSSSKGFKGWSDIDLKNTLDRCYEEIDIAESSRDFVEAEIKRRKLRCQRMRIRKQGSKS
jgi:hypothetical protein